MTLLRKTLAVFFVVLAMLQSTSVSATSCTEDEQSAINNVYSNLTNSRACADLIANSDATSLDYCMNSDCTSELSTAVDQLPECTSDDETDRRTGLQAIVTYCADVIKTADQSAPTTENTDSIVSSASRGFLTASVLATQFSVVFYFILQLL